MTPSLRLSQCELAASRSDNLLKTQLVGLHIGFLWLSVLLKYHYRETERRETRDKEQKIETNTEAERDRYTETEKETDKDTEGVDERGASGVKE